LTDRTLGTRLRGAARELLGPRPHPSPSPYAQWLLRGFHEYLTEQFGDATLPFDTFAEVFWRHQRSGIIRAANRYVGDLWDLFAPDYRRRLPEYYAQQELQLTMTFLAYAGQPELLDAHFLQPYREMRRRFPKPSILEIGPGIPHGFLANVHRDGGGWCRALTIVELDAQYARFTGWVCARHGIPFERIPAIAAQAPAISTSTRFDFVFAKDVFEHLDAPDRALAEIVRVAATPSLLALDLTDHGSVEYQHISPRLSAHAAVVEAAGFVRSGQAGHLTIFTR
jgi:hypothetical protein